MEVSTQLDSTQLPTQSPFKDLLVFLFTRNRNMPPATPPKGAWGHTAEDTLQLSSALICLKDRGAGRQGWGTCRAKTTCFITLPSPSQDSAITQSSSCVRLQATKSLATFLFLMGAAPRAPAVTVTIHREGWGQVCTMTDCSFHVTHRGSVVKRYQTLPRAAALSCRGRCKRSSCSLAGQPGVLRMPYMTLGLAHDQCSASISMVQ